MLTQLLLLVVAVVAVYLMIRHRNDPVTLGLSLIQAAIGIYLLIAPRLA